MFNGIIYKIGVIEKLIKAKNSLEIIVKSQINFKKNEIGNSINCNGACLTLTNIDKNLITFYLSKETLNKTNFRYVKKGGICTKH